MLRSTAWPKSELDRRFCSAQSPHFSHVTAIETFEDEQYAVRRTEISHVALGLFVSLRSLGHMNEGFLGFCPEFTRRSLRYNPYI